MAEQEVIKHVKKAYKIWRPGQGKFWPKFKEFLLEIIIIVFAVTLSIGLHDRSEKKHIDKDTKDFLLGMQLDFERDIKEMQEDIESFELQRSAFIYLRGLKQNHLPEKDSIDKYYTWIVNTTELIPNNGRFEGFKSAGKIATISNKELQNSILDLYQEDIPSVLSRTRYYNIQKQAVNEFINLNVKRTSDSTSNLYEILTSDEIYNRGARLAMISPITLAYQRCIQRMKDINNEINRLYKVNKLLPES